MSKLFKIVGHSLRYVYKASKKVLIGGLGIRHPDFIKHEQIIGGIGLIILGFAAGMVIKFLLWIIGI